MPAAFVEVYRADDEHVVDIASAVMEYVENTLRHSLPNGVSVDVSPPSIRRRDGQPVVTVTADVDSGVISGGEATAVLADDVIPELAATTPGLAARFGGEAEQQYESFDALNRGSFSPFS